jgi:CheY-like chemotaxis protein
LQLMTGLKRFRSSEPVDFVSEAECKPPIVSEIASVECDALKGLFAVSKDDRLRNINALIEQIRAGAIVSFELLEFDKTELIAKASADWHQWASLLSALADTIDSLKALQEIVGAAETRMAVALANIEGADPRAVRIRPGTDQAACQYLMTQSSAPDPLEDSSSDDLIGLDILLVEDSRCVGEAMKGLLKLLGADVAGPAANGAEAQHLLSEHTPDVALVDFHLRGGELAYDLIARLRDQGVPVIVVSGSGMPEFPTVEVAAILQKPVSEELLLAALRPLIAQKAVR